MWRQAYCCWLLVVHTSLHHYLLKRSLWEIIKFTYRLRRLFPGGLEKSYSRKWPLEQLAVVFEWRGGKLLSWMAEAFRLNSLFLRETRTCLSKEQNCRWERNPYLILFNHIRCFSHSFHCFRMISPIDWKDFHKMHHWPAQSIEPKRILDNGRTGLIP